MKRIYFLGISMLLLILAINTFAQESVKPEVITVNVSDLTPGQLAKIKADAVATELSNKINTYGKWAGMGKEVGIAVKEGLMSVVDVADKFGDTKVGEFTMYMIAWKVIGEDIVRIFLGIIFLFIVNYLILREVRKMSPYKLRTKGSWYKFWDTSEFEVVTPDDYDGITVIRMVYIALIAVSFGLTYAIMFA